MSKNNLKKVLNKELKQLNETIDQKIVRGLSYSQEARRHKCISHTLIQIAQEKNSDSGWFSQSIRLPSIFPSAFSSAFTSSF